MVNKIISEEIERLIREETERLKKSNDYLKKAFRQKETQYKNLLKEHQDLKDIVRANSGKPYIISANLL